MIFDYIKKIGLLALVLFFSNSAIAGDLINLKHFSSIKNPELKLDYLAKADDGLFAKVMPDISLYYGSYNEFVSRNINNPQFSELIRFLSENAKSNQHLYILGLLYEAKNQHTFFDGFKAKSKESYYLRFKDSVISVDSNKARSVLYSSCSGNYLAACSSYFFAVNNYSLPCIMNIETHNCDARMIKLAESEKMYIDAAIYNYNIIPSENKRERKSIASMISQVYTGGVTGVMTVEHYADWIKKYSFPRDDKQAKKWAQIANTLEN